MSQDPRFKKLWDMRKRKIAAAEKRDGIIDGNTYRLTIDDHRGSGYAFYKVRYVFYPKEQWMFAHVNFFGDGSVGSYHPLDDETRAKLETWL